MRLTRIAAIIALFLLLLAIFSPLAPTMTASLDALIDSVSPLLRLQIPTIQYTSDNGTLRQTQEVAVVDITPLMKALARVLILLLPLAALILMLRVRI